MRSTARSVWVATMSVIRWVFAGGWLRRGTLVFASLVGVAVLFLGFQYGTAASLGGVQPEPGAWVNSKQVSMEAAVPRLKPGSADVVVVLDGAVVPNDQVQLAPDGVRLMRELPDGPHSVQVELRSSNLFARRLVQSWSFSVDTTPPGVTFESPARPEAIARKGGTLSVRFDEAVRARISVDGAPVAQGEAVNSLSHPLELAEGKHQMLVEATDPAGNTTRKEWQAWADYNPPQVSVLAMPEGTWEKSEAGLVVMLEDGQTDGLGMRATMDDKPLTVQAKSAADATILLQAKSPTGSRQGSSPGVTPPKLQEDGKTKFYYLPTGVLAEGTHRLRITATDVAGHSTEKTNEFLVDSSSRFGEKELAAGAVGEDVKTLQRVLAARGAYAGKATGKFDEATAAAVVKYKQDRGLEATPVVDKQTATKMLGAIKIDLSELKLYLLDDGKVVKSYRIAAGSSQYPTPTGQYYIATKEYNPTWRPPPSPWAAGEEPIPPGPGNPLGTRWMGLDHNLIGIHGTYQDWTVGTYASHGCLRMHIPQVEELFELVYVGTPVTIAR